MTEYNSDLILARLQTLHPKCIDLSLARIERLLARLGHPERQLPPVVHIAGTNGKGSTLAMLDAMLTAAGRKVHRYISPHLVRFNERILIHGHAIAEDALASVLDECERANDGEPITFFEITTAAAFLAFARTPADYLLLETGLGGRLDATNVVERPELTLISPVSMDHEGYLGDTLTSIAGEKAGIIKCGAHVLAGPQRPEAQAVLEARCREQQASLRTAGRDWRVVIEGEGFTLHPETLHHETHHHEAGALALPRPRLAGLHQFENAGLAAMAALTLGLDRRPIAAGLKQARWAARLQPITTGPLVRRLSRGSELWLDGGHNPAAGEALASSLPQIARGRPVHLVFGMLETKNVAAFLGPLAPHVTSVRSVPVPDEALGRDPEAEAAIARGLGMHAEAQTDIESAIADIVAGEPGESVILICGSLYLAAHVLRRLV